MYRIMAIHQNSISGEVLVRAFCYFYFIFYFLNRGKNRHHFEDTEIRINQKFLKTVEKYGWRGGGGNILHLVE